MRQQHERRLAALRRAADANPGATVTDYLDKLRDLLRNAR